MRTKAIIIGVTMLIMLAGVLAPLSVQSIQPIIQENQEFSTIARGLYSGWSAQSFLVIKDAGTWQRVWGVMTSIFNPQPIVPQVNFSQDMVIAAFAGHSRSLCYTINITNIVIYKGRQQLVYITITPIPLWFSNPSVDTPTQVNPYHIVKTEKTDLPIRFIVTKP